MFAKFKLSSIDIQNEKYYRIGKSLYDENYAATSSRLEDYVAKNNALSAQKIEEEWFPQIDADIFLSHSHADEKTVITLAGWLKGELGVNAFVDSCVWAYCEDLIRIMEKKWNSGNNDVISRQICSHVNMMLNTSLHKMIDSTECLIFLDTPQSVAYKDFLNKSALYSPWIYNELLMGNLIQSKPLLDHRKSVLNESLQHFSTVKIEYKICLDEYENMDEEILSKWKTTVSSRRNNLSKRWTSYDSMDILYN